MKYSTLLRPAILLSACLLLQSPAWSDSNEATREETIQQIKRERTDQRQRARRPLPSAITGPVLQAVTPPAGQIYAGQGYGYSKENPVKLGGADLSEGPTMSKVYLRRLRDRNNQPLQFERIGNVGANEENHIVDLYRLVDSTGVEYRLYVDMYHPDLNPLTLKAPEGLGITP